MKKLTVIDIKNMLDEMDIPVAYHHFPANKTPTLPFLAYRFPYENPFFADGVNYSGFYDMDIRLVTEEKDFELEKQLEDLLKREEINYIKAEYWIEEEKIFEIYYDCEVYII